MLESNLSDAVISLSFKIGLLTMSRKNYLTFYCSISPKPVILSKVTFHPQKVAKQKNGGKYSETPFFSILEAALHLSFPERLYFCALMADRNFLLNSSCFRNSACSNKYYAILPLWYNRFFMLQLFLEHLWWCMIWIFRKKY